MKNPIRKEQNNQYILKIEFRQLNLDEIGQKPISCFARAELKHKAVKIVQFVGGKTNKTKLNLILKSVQVLARGILRDL